MIQGKNYNKKKTKQAVDLLEMDKSLKRVLIAPLGLGYNILKGIKIYIVKKNFILPNHGQTH